MTLFQTQHMPFWSKIDFQSFLNYVSSMLESLNDFILAWMVFILAIVFLLGYLIFKFELSYLKLEHEYIEIFWTFFPMAILASIALPSLFLLNLQDVLLPQNILKVMSNQWNWQSEGKEEMDHLLDYESLSFKTSFETPMISSTGSTQVVLTSTDVLHSLGIPELTLKLDSSPGRLNSTVFSSAKPGLYWGSCYELCGTGHSVMPLSLLSLLE